MQEIPFCESSTFPGQAAWEEAWSSTQRFLPLMHLFEQFADYCFAKQLTFFADSGTLLGAVRHRGVIPWDYDGDVGMWTSSYRRLVQEFEPTAGFALDLDCYKEPDATLGVVPCGTLCDPFPLIDVVRFDEDGRNFQSEATQKRWPLDMWRGQPSENSWNYDLFPDEQGALVGLPMWCGLFRAPAGWPKRLDRHYGGWQARPQSLDRAAQSLPFDPMVPAVRLVPQYPVLSEAFRRTDRKRPFVIRGLLAIEAQEAPQNPETQLGQLRSGIVLKDVATASVVAGTKQPFTKVQSGGAIELLLSGERYVWVVSEKDAELIDLRGRSMTSIVTDEDFSLWGHVYVVQQRPGDILFLPKGVSHRVYTYKASMVVKADI